MQHAPFEYTISAENNSGAPREGTCRIFFCPKHDERGQTLRFRDQRTVLIEMDKFPVTCKIHRNRSSLIFLFYTSYTKYMLLIFQLVNPGPNTIKRRSDESSVKIPYERSFRRIGSDYQPTGAAELAQFQFCGCGWPQHLLIPKGTAEGAKYDIFVMISDMNEDRVNQTSN